MGLGKSFQAIVAAAEEPGDVVIVCPASLKENWAREIRKADIEGTIKIVNGGETYNYYESEGKTWLIINYDVLDRYVDAIIGTYTNGIYDEAHYIKNQRTKRTKAALKLAKALDVLYLLTGTPVANRPVDLYTLLAAIDHPLGKSWYGFVMKYCGGHMREFWRKVQLPNGQYERRKMKFLETGGATNLGELATKIADSYLRRDKSQLGDKLPAKIVDTIKVELPKEYREKYVTAWDTYLEYIENDPDGVDEQSLINKVLARHLIELGKLKQVASLGKLDRVVDDITEIVEAEEKVLVFTQYTETVRQLQEKLLAKKIKSVSLTGSDDMAARTKAVDEIQEGSTPVFIGNIKAAGVGITLTAANTVLFTDMEWTPAMQEQAEDRAHRIGQHKQVNVHYYIAKDTVDQDIADLLGVKAKIIEKVLAGKETGKVHSTGKMVAEIVARNRAKVIH